ncbi:MAG: NADH-quinone oxidoreductase subunit J [Chitinophagales bacterium]
MSARDIIFYIIAGFILGNGLLAMITRKIFRSAIFLLFSLIGVAGLYFWLQVEFIAAVQIIVYVGGIVVLIIFSIFLTQQSGEEMPKVKLRRNLFSMISVLLGAGLTAVLIAQNNFEMSTGKLNVQPSNIGTQMLDYENSGMALPFEVVSILLLAAMVGCIVIAIKDRTTEEKMVKEREN